MLQYIASFVVSIVASAVLTWGVRSFARKFGWAHAPESPRHLHLTPIPRLGGVAVFLTFQLLFWAYFLAAGKGWVATSFGPQVSRIVIVAVALFAVGLADDLCTLGARTKLLVQIGGALGLYFSGVRFNFCAVMGVPWSPWVCLALTVLWVVLICNAINLIDGLDGLAAGAALFSMVTIFTLALGNRPNVAMATAILGGSLFGFLIFNFSPASIFLGDAGSLFVGFVLSALVLAESQHAPTALYSILVPVVSFALPLTDVAVSLLRRFLSGHSLFGADREHIHHKLLELGLSQRQVVWILYGISALCAVLSLFLLRPGKAALIPVAAIMLLTLFFGLRKLNYYEFGEFERLGRRIAAQRKVFARNIAVRKAASGLQTTGDSEQIVQWLESCLAEDFDGFEIQLNQRFIRGSVLVAPWTGAAIRRHWNQSRDRMVLTLDLTTVKGQIIGSLSLVQNADCELLIDTELIKGDLRLSLAIALENALSRPLLAPVSVPAIKPRRRGIPQMVAEYFDREARG